MPIPLVIGRHLVVDKTPLVHAESNTTHPDRSRRPGTTARLRNRTHIYGARSGLGTSRGFETGVGAGANSRESPHRPGLWLILAARRSPRASIQSRTLQRLGFDCSTTLSGRGSVGRSQFLQNRGNRLPSSEAGVSASGRVVLFVAPPHVHQKNYHRHYATVLRTQDLTSMGDAFATRQASPSFEQV